MLDVDMKTSQKASYIMKEWCATFPLHTDLSFKDVSNLASRSRDIGNWYKEVSEEYTRFSKAPAWFLNTGKTPNDWSDEVQNKFLEIKELSRESSIRLNKISLTAKKDMARENDEHRERMIKLIHQTPEVAFQIMTTSILPIETHMKVFEFSSKDEAKEYLEKSLQDYRERMYSKFQNGELSVDDLINILFVK
jgi:hypothetical protein